MRDVLFQVLNYKLLFLNDILYYVTHGNQTHKFSILHNGQVADFFTGHDLHALLDAGFTCDSNGLLCHYFANKGFFGGLPSESKLTRIMTLSENAQEFAIVNYEQCSDIFLEHYFERLIHRDSGGNGIDCVALRLNDISDFSHMTW